MIFKYDKSKIRNKIKMLQKGKIWNKMFMQIHM